MFSRYARSDGLLYGLEFLTDENGRRVAAFSYWAGYAGTAIALLSWAHQLLNVGKPQGPVPVFDTASALTDYESVLKWDMAETASDGPFPECRLSDLLVNCAYLDPHRIPPFVTHESLSAPGRRLRVICDVSCDPSENNPIPVYSGYSSFENPTIATSPKIGSPELRVIAIDHLPTFVARESSEEYSRLLLLSLLTLDLRDIEGVWKRAKQTYRDRVKELP
ncbi:hypothetical protein DL767_001175 [Monosporascus sp. MG133]|nr:hypothetical protein DL767_001175 [Monosporascus sp. MG133]